MVTRVCMEKYSSAFFYREMYFLFIDENKRIHPKNGSKTNNDMKE